MNKIKIAVFWFRRDLRLYDNTALNAALSSGLPVLPIFIFDQNILEKLEEKENRRVDFIHSRLLEIQKELRAAGSSIMVLHDTPARAFTWLIESFSTDKEFSIDCVFCNRDYEPYAQSRDKEVSDMLTAKGIGFSSHKDQVIFEPWEVLKPDGEPYTVFTPYSRKWKELLSKESETSNSFLKSDKNYLKSHDVYLKLDDRFLKTSNLGLDDASGDIPSLEQLGFVKTFVNSFVFKSESNLSCVPVIDHSVIVNYHNTRNFPAIEGTSRLSAHLRFGTVSIRELVKKGLLLNDIWLNELIWREFFFSILYHFPRVVDEAFKEKYRFIKWRNDEKEFEKWCKGETGFPIVDAGMRELNATGFMHNRVRMITASFLTKDLLIDWRIGEAYFAQKLLDFELSSNNGNWQWAAGCGCDAAPYFRVFSPYEQTRKFDPQFEYIKRWVPEFEDNGLAFPKYPSPVVDHSFARLRALEVFKQALSETKKL